MSFFLLYFVNFSAVARDAFLSWRLDEGKKWKLYDASVKRDNTSDVLWY